MSKPIVIGVLGANSHVAKAVLPYFDASVDYTVKRFSRQETDLRYDTFLEHSLDVVMNCVGVVVPKATDTLSAMSVNEQFDSLALTYLNKHPHTRYIFMSSGAVYGDSFDAPVSDQTECSFTPNHLHATDFYRLSKLHSEAKHRQYANLNIMDVRIFGFFSQFINSSDHYFLCDVLRAILTKTVLQTSSQDFIRDYVHPKDFFDFLKCCLRKKNDNRAVDVYSKAPVSKFELLDHLKTRYGLDYEIKSESQFHSPNGYKNTYYSGVYQAKALGYTPRYTSLETVCDQLDRMVVI